jgi:SAM-dependent methyltransferase
MVLGMSGSTAGEWDRIWSRVAAAGQDLPPPDPDVVRLAGELSGEASRVRRILDLGCGRGRHTVYLAAAGFDVYASDFSPVAVGHCREALAAAGLAAEVREGTAARIDYPDGFFDWVLSVSVLYHGRRGDVATALAEARRVLRPGGWFFATFISTADDKMAWYRQERPAGRAEELEPGTYRALLQGLGDEHVPHTFLAEADFRPSEASVVGQAPLMDGYEIVTLREERRRAGDFAGKVRQRADWNLLARRTGPSGRVVS